MRYLLVIGIYLFAYFFARYCSSKKIEGYIITCFVITLGLRITFFSIGESKVWLVRYTTDYFNMSLINLIATYFEMRVIVNIFVKEKYRIKKSCILPLLYVMVNIISIVQAGNKMAAIMASLRAIELLFIFIYFSVCFNDKTQICAFYRGVKISSVYVSVIALIQKVKGGAIGLAFLGEMQSGFRTHAISGVASSGVSGLFEHSGDLALFCVFVFILVLFGRKYYKNRYTYFANIILVLVAILFSDSRMSILMVAIAVIIFIFKSQKGFKLNKEAGILIIAGFIILPMLLLFNSHLISMISSVFQKGTFDVRLSQWTIAFEEILDNPFWGHGANNYVDFMYTNRNDLYRAVWNYQNPVHNTFLLLWFELGIWGLVVNLLIQINFIKPLFRKKNQDSLSIASATFVLISLIYWLFDWGFMKSPAIYFLWIAYGLAVNKVGDIY